MDLNHLNQNTEILIIIQFKFAACFPDAEREGFEPPGRVTAQRFSLLLLLLHKPSSALSVQML